VSLGLGGRRLVAGGGSSSSVAMFRCHRMPDAKVPGGIGVCQLRPMADGVDSGGWVTG